MAKYLFCFLFIGFLSSLEVLGSVRFIQITDPHIFEEENRAYEARNSRGYFQITIDKMNQIALALKDEFNENVDFVMLTGDIGIEKLLKKSLFGIDKDFPKLTKDTQKWDDAKNLMAEIIQDSNIKKWFFVPGNNDIYKENHKTIQFFGEFLKELQEMPEIKEANIEIIDFRIESSQKADPKSSPGVYTIGDFAFIGWDNSYFKNNNSVKKFIDKNNKVIDDKETEEYQSIQQLSKVIESSNAKYAYIFYHIPEVDDPYMITFDVDDENEQDNSVTRRLQEAKKLAPKLAKEIYTYSAWTIPLGVRMAWESLATNKTFKTPEIKGLFAGHFHDNKKEVYENFKWLRTKIYNKDILKKLYIAPSISIKNQHLYPFDKRARGGQVIKIEDNGTVKRKFFWFDE